MRSLSVASSGARERPPSEVYARVKLLTKFVEMADALSSSEIASLIAQSIEVEGSAEATVLHAEQNEIEKVDYQNRKRSYQNRNLTAAAAQKRLLKPKQLSTTFPSFLFLEGYLARFLLH